MKKDTVAVKTGKDTVKPTKAKASKCACPYCDEELTADKTPLFCSPCSVTTTAAKPAVKSRSKAT
jgi:hypothetical protein